MTTNPNEQTTDAVNRTAQELLAALLAKDSSKVNSYYAADAVIATPGRPAAKDGRAVGAANSRCQTVAANSRISNSVVLLDVDLDIRSTPGAAGETGEEIGHSHLPAVLRQ